MATWNLVLVGHDLEETIQQTVADFVVALEGIGHVLDSATLTTDTGQSDVPVASAAPEVTPSESTVVSTDSPPPSAPANDDPPDDVAVDTPPSL